jgi:hypothetical protein
MPTHPSTDLSRPALIRSRCVSCSPETTAETIADAIENSSTFSLDTTTTQKYTAYTRCHADSTKDYTTTPPFNADFVASPLDIRS